MDLYKYIKAHNTLNPKIWKDFELKDEVREKINDIVTIFTDNMKADNIDIKIADIWILGSNASYNYNANSDLDVHIMVNMTGLDIDSKILNKIYMSYRNLFKNVYDPKIKGIPVELYVEDINTSNNASEGIYSLTGGWIKKPQKEDIEINSKEMNAKYEYFVDEFNSLMERISHEDINYQIEQVSKLLSDIYSLRQEDLYLKGEFSVGNLVFKELRSKGYIELLRDLKVKLENIKMTLD